RAPREPRRAPRRPREAARAGPGGRRAGESARPPADGRPRALRRRGGGRGGGAARCLHAGATQAAPRRPPRPPRPARQLSPRVFGPMMAGVADKAAPAIRALLVEDDPKLAALTAEYLKGHGDGGWVW